MNTHPVAELFPLLGEAELDELAADIKANGLRHPIVVDGEGRIVDGRNRLLACERAGVEPDFVTADGADPLVVAISENVRRRNLTASQLAIAAARAWDELAAGKGVRAKNLARIFGVSHAYVTQARALVERDPDGAAAVAAGTTPLAVAYDELREREREHESRATKLARLRASRPDLVERVEALELTLDEALDLADADERREHEHAVTAAETLGRAVRVLVDEPDNVRPLLERLARHDVVIPATASDCRAAVAFLGELANGLEVQ